ncbi:MAG: hypothetical protein IPH12_11910 [Saprospirales bacterium]|nr:hypothetical protein [Saprospirales bacterium]
MKKTILIVFQIILGKLLFAQSTNSLSFLGSNAYVVLDALAQPMSQTTDFTVEFWMKANRSDNTNSPRVALFAINPWVQGVPENKLLIIMGGSRKPATCSSWKMSAAAPGSKLPALPW